MIIREARLEDAFAIAKVHVDAWRTTYRGIVPDDYLASLSYEKRESSWGQMLSTAADSQHCIYVAEDQIGQIVAFADGGSERTNNPVYKGELYAIYIQANYQRQGLGRNLTLSVVKRLRALGLDSMMVWVLAENPACRFYEALGGQKVDEKQIERSGVKLKELAYGWKDTRVLMSARLEAR